MYGFLNPKKAYKIHYVNKNQRGYIIKVGDLFIVHEDKYRDAIKSIKKRTQ